MTGRKQLREEKNRQLVQRRQQARNAQRKYMDEVMFLASKDMRDAARRVNRTLRDFYTDRAEEQARSVNEELAALDKAARIKDEARQRRVAELDGELGRLRALHGRLRSAIPA